MFLFIILQSSVSHQSPVARIKLFSGDTVALAPVLSNAVQTISSVFFCLLSICFPDDCLFLKSDICQCNMFLFLTTQESMSQSVPVFSVLSPDLSGDVSSVSKVCPCVSLRGSSSMSLC